MKLQGQIVDIHQRKIFPGEVEVDDGLIRSIRHLDHVQGPYILPGFVDAHVHIESSMLIPSEFARLAVVHGTVGTVSDPHEIANVLGEEGVRFMIRNGQQVPFHFAFGVPSCVPATPFETAGETLDVEAVRRLFIEEDLLYLSEMMNYPGVLARDPLVMDKIAVAQEFGRVIDGHAPGLLGDDAQKYAAAGMTTDHECFTLEEGRCKADLGMKILIREGSAAKNFEALEPLIRSHPQQVMFCSDDKHPDALVKGHINELVARAVHAKGHDLFDVLRCACLHPIEHYGLGIGTLREGESADFIVVEDLESFQVKETYIQGQCVAKGGEPFIQCVEANPLNRFEARRTAATDFVIQATGPTIRVIAAEEGQLVTQEEHYPAKVEEGCIVADVERDILKLAVVNRYEKALPAVAFIKNFGLKRGAIASCIAHDSHNIIAVGTSDQALSDVINSVIDARGGIAVVDGSEEVVLPLPVAGIMSADEGKVVAEQYAKVEAQAKALGSPLHAPFMTLSFMALLVIPSLKLSDKGLFDGSVFQFSSVVV